MWMRFLAIVTGILLTGFVSAGTLYPLPSDGQHVQFNRLSHQLRCLVCQNEDLADSGAALAKDLRLQLYHKVLQHKTDAQIKHYMVARYGDFVLFDPPVVKRTYLLWYGPWALLLLAGIIFVCVLRKHSQRSERS